MTEPETDGNSSQSSLPFSLFLSAAMVLAITAVGMVFQPVFDRINIALLYLLPVLISAVRWGIRPSLFTSILGMLCFDLFFVPPIMSFTVNDIRHLLNLAIFLMVAIVTGTLASRIRSQADLAREGERRTTTLYTLSHKIAAEKDLPGVLRTIARTVAEHLKADVIILMPGPPYNTLSMAAGSFVDCPILDNREKSIAQWVFEHRKPAGQGTDVPNADPQRLYLPIFNGETSLAVFVLYLNPGRSPTERERKDMEAFASLAALAITRMHLAFEAEQVKWLAESEKLHHSLLNAVSHDLRTPLASITGAVTSLLGERDRYDHQTSETLLETIREGAQRMNRFIANLLDMARLESGILKPKKEWIDITDVIGVAIKETRDILPENRLVVHVPADLRLVQADFALIEQVLINLLENGAKYSPPDTRITVSVEEKTGHLIVAIGDQAAPIPEAEHDRLFDKFYRLRESKHVSGTGLGLSICKGIVEAHGGRIWVESSEAKPGNVFVFTIPLPKDQPLSMPAVPKEENSVG